MLAFGVPYLNWNCGRGVAEGLRAIIKHKLLQFLCFYIIAWQSSGGGVWCAYRIYHDWMTSPMLYSRLLPFAVLFFALQALLRFTLMIKAFHDVQLAGGEIMQILLKGFWFDVVAGCFCLLPIALYHVLLPQRKHGGRGDGWTDAGLRFVFLYLMLFDLVAEHLFWDEFSTRFNFIAVDYLVYTQEVVGNISESYPLPWLLAGIGVAAAGVGAVSLLLWPMRQKPSPFGQRLRQLAMLLAFCALTYTVSSTEQAQMAENAEATELASNGIYNLFSAFWNNEINYDRFYARESEQKVNDLAHALMKEEYSDFLNEPDSLTRLVRGNGRELHKNVVMVVMESMSAEYMQAFGNTTGLTPNLDRLSGEGLFFTQLLATGTRTVRGLEALTLSIPPTPGQSIVRRPGNENLFSLGFVFQDRGYRTQFIYGGYGYFDNMNYFFSHNGFEVIDRNLMAADEVQFANVWGICDEDMFARAIREGDKAYAEGKPFFQLIMTTSNHRPYTYPSGRIDIPSHSNRLGGVKYADYSVGKLVEWAKEKPWFNDTVFVFVADHTAGAGGKAELDSKKYHIPAIVYAPGFVPVSRYEKLASQIDVAPVLLGLLNFTYYSKFYGEDLLRDDVNETSHAFISNFQKVALVKGDELTVLSPKQRVEQYAWPDISTVSRINNARVDEAIAYYQSASWWKTRYGRIPTVAMQTSANRD
ncbi:MAG: alkaline phosphatase family protein [Proteobacteria bacterium]|nr:alkaline phosphatase family protein [Pseudomonadota bacterium]